MVDTICVGKNYNMLFSTGDLAYNGHCVKLFDLNGAALNYALLQIEKDQKKLREEGLLNSPNIDVS